MKGRLNLFQSSMLRWREMHPYNAVHVVTLPQPLDPQRLEACIKRRLEGLGLTGLTLDGRRLRYEWTGGAAKTPLAVLAGGADPTARVQAEMERQLNLRFPDSGGIEPFRFFAVEDAPAFHLGLAYDHFVAGGDSIVRLLRMLVADYYRLDPVGDDMKSIGDGGVGERLACQQLIRGAIFDEQDIDRVIHHRRLVHWQRSVK